MPSERIVSFPEGLRTPAHLELSGPSPFDAEGPAVFSVDWLDGERNIVFHFNPRPGEREIALNSHLDGRWKKEDRVREYPFALEPDVPFRLRFDVEPKRFVVSVDGRELCRFKHRRPPGTIVELRSSTFLWRLDCDGTARVPEAGPPEAAAPGQADAAPVESFRLFAILSTWLEEDVVEATVRNALLQGCERVYLVDNGSPDRTVERALAAGATLAGSYASDRYREEERVAAMQAVVDEVSIAQGDDHVWWLWLDADEFHHGPAGLTVREYLAVLDRRFRLVGARFFNHLPSGKPEYVEGRHPLDFQPLCFELPVPNCDLGHFKHPLQRWDRGGSHIASGPGFHLASSREPLLEPAVGIFCHHFSYREEERTRARLGRLFGDDGGPDRVADHQFHAHLRLRRRSLDAVYAGRWRDVAFFPPCVPGYVPELRAWSDWVAPADAAAARWN